MQNKDGMTYAPIGKRKAVVKKGEFVFSVIGLDHGHIYGMTNGLLEAGASIKYVYDSDIKKVNAFIERYPEVTLASHIDQVLQDPTTHLIAGACVTSERAELGMKVMKAGKDYFTDKAPFTSLDQIECVKALISETKKKYLVYYSELIHVEGAVYAKDLVQSGAIGKVVQVMGLGPHRLRAKSRPDWFFKKDKYGGILCDIGSHNIYQFLEYADIDHAQVVSSQVGNYKHPEYPELEDFGDAMLLGENGATCYFRVDWFTPDGLKTWGDGRLMILGTDGYIEVRKYCDVGRSPQKDNLILVNHEGESFMHVNGQVGFPFFGDLILDCLNRTEHAQSQHRALKASELSIIAQNQAVKVSKE